jgi:hypothetical protein
LVFAIELEWVPVSIVHYCNFQVAEHLGGDNEFEGAWGATERQMEYHQGKE